MKFLFFWISLIFTYSYSSAQYVYQQLNNSDGLSNSTINRMFQDKDNLIWVATLDGLNVYDGSTFHVFNYENRDTKNAIASNIIYQISEDKNRNIWLATAEGVTKYSKTTGKFNNYYLNKSKVTTNGYFLGIDSLGTVYSARINTGEISYYNEKLDTFERCEVEGLKEAMITKMAIDKQGRLWLFKNNSLEVYARKGNSFYKLKGFPVIKNVDNLLFTNYTIFYTTNKKELFRVSANLVSEKKLDLPAKVRSMTSYQKRYIFAWTTKGIGEYDLDFKPSPLISKSIPILNTVKINNLITGKEQMLWCGTDGNGIIKIAKKQTYFGTLVSDHTPLNTQINAFADVNNEIWIGTKGNGIMVSKGAEQPATRFLPIQSIYKPSGLFSDNSVYSIKKSKDKLVYIGSDASGIVLYDMLSKKFTDWKHIIGTEKYPAFNSVHAILLDADNSAWLGTYSSGLVHLKLKRNSNNQLAIQFLHTYRYTGTDQGPGNDVISALEKGNDGRIWIACRFGGLSIFNQQTKRFQTLKSSANEGSLSNNDVLSVYKDSKGSMWVGTSFGLNVLKGQETGAQALKFKKFGTADGLPNNTIHAINEDFNGDIWVSTNKGLGKIDPENAIMQFIVQDGLQGNEFSDNAIWKNEQNYLYFGGLHGANYFKPKKIRVSNNQANLVISDLKFAGKIEDEYVINVLNLKNWTDKKIPQYTLNREDNFFDLKVNTVQFTDQEKCQYAYFLEGNDKTWHYPGDDKRISYSNLQPGFYTLKLKWSNGSGTWNKEVKAFNIHVKQYFWLTRAAFGLYLLVLGIGAYLFHVYRKNKLLAQHELKLEYALRKKDEEIYKEQVNYFTNIAHELQTPLTIISGTLEQYFYKSKKIAKEDPNKNLLSIVNEQSSRLNYLVYQLLEFRKAEEGHLKNQFSYLNASDLIFNIVQLFTSLAEQKEMDCSCYIEPNIRLWTDKDKLEKIIFNLLSNAYKHSGNKQQIVCSLNRSQNQKLELIVANSGCNLKEAELQNLFTRFFVSDSNQQTKISTGLGLAFTKQLISLLKGSIEVNCKNGWIYFKVNLPLNYIPDSIEKLEEKHEKSETPSYLISSISNENVKLYDTSSEKNNKQAVLNRLEYSDKKSILVIEDDPAIRFLLNDILKEQYIVYEAGNGKEALEIINKMLPDLIVSDIMMPDMSGLEICNRVKNLPNTCHIPFLILSAKSTIDQQIEGYEAGADAYISKPFHIEHLQVRIKRLLDYHQDLHNFFKQDNILSNLSTSGMKDDDKSFLEKTITLIETNVEKEELDAQFLEKQLAMSKAYFYRRLKTLSGMTPGELIKKIRLQHAAGLLQNSNLTVSEVFYRSGFNNQSHFFREFKKQYQISPSDYRLQFKVV